MPFDIAAGTSTAAEALQPLDATGLPGIQQPTAILPGQLAGPTYDALDTTTMFQEQMAAGEADARAAQAVGMAAETDRRSHYQGQIGDAMDLPLVPDAAEPATQSDLYPYAGQEPTPAGVGFYHGDLPTLPE